jgi:hypothetical protein
MVKGFGCRPSEAAERPGVGRRPKAAHARTRGLARRVYGDFKDTVVVAQVIGAAACRSGPVTMREKEPQTHDAAA